MNSIISPYPYRGLAWYRLPDDVIIVRPQAGAPRTAVAAAYSVVFAAERFSTDVGGDARAQRSVRVFRARGRPCLSV
jgi:hypothetical protein